jgi:hypothetical protein
MFYIRDYTYKTGLMRYSLSATGWTSSDLPSWINTPVRSSSSICNGYTSIFYLRTWQLLQLMLECSSELLRYSTSEHITSSSVNLALLYCEDLNVLQAETILFIIAWCLTLIILEPLPSYQFTCNRSPVYPPSNRNWSVVKNLTTTILAEEFKLLPLVITFYERTYHLEKCQPGTSR